MSGDQLGVRFYRDQIESTLEQWLQVDGELGPVVSTMCALLQGTIEEFTDFSLVDDTTEQLQAGRRRYEQLLDGVERLIDELKASVQPVWASVASESPLDCPPVELARLLDSFHELLLGDLEAKQAVLDTLLDGQVPTATQRAHYERLFALHTLALRSSALDPIRQVLTVACQFGE